MPPELVLNELSLQKSNSRDIAKSIMLNFLKCVATLGRKGAIGHVRISSSLAEFEIAEGYPIGYWLGDHEVDPDAIRLYKSRIGLGPYLTQNEVQILKSDYDLEVQVGGKESLGCEAAYLLGGIVLSFATAPSWNEDVLKVEVTKLRADDKFEMFCDWLNHVSEISHIENHQDLFAQESDLTPKDVWLTKLDVYPSLLFCESLEHEFLHECQNQKKYQAILKKLSSLNEYFCNWTDGGFELDDMKSKCTPETQQTLNENENQLSRVCADGISRLFSLHLRYTPGAGRIYFYPDASLRKAHIGFIQQKFIY
jgi:hypothetical protein